MADATNTNDDVWKSDRMVANWVAGTGARERHRSRHRRLMADLLPFDRDEPFTFVDLGAGTGAATRAVLDAFPRASAILAEYSAQMAAEGGRALSSYEGRYRYVDFDLAQGDWPADLPTGAPAMISSLCVHHLPDERKRALFAEIWDHLAPGGWYFNYDPVAAGDPVVEAAWLRAGDRQDPDAEASRRNRSPDEQQRHENHVRYIIPLAPQLAFLEEAGFEAIDVYWKQLDHVIYGGRRPSGRASG